MSDLTLPTFDAVATLWVRPGLRTGWGHIHLSPSLLTWRRGSALFNLWLGPFKAPDQVDIAIRDIDRVTQFRVMTSSGLTIKVGEILYTFRLSEGLSLSGSTKTTNRLKEELDRLRAEA